MLALGSSSTTFAADTLLKVADDWYGTAAVVSPAAAATGLHLAADGKDTAMTSAVTTFGDAFEAW